MSQLPFLNILVVGLGLLLSLAVEVLRDRVIDVKLEFLFEFLVVVVRILFGDRLGRSTWNGGCNGSTRHTFLSSKSLRAGGYPGGVFFTSFRGSWADCSSRLWPLCRRLGGHRLIHYFLRPLLCLSLLLSLLLGLKLLSAGCCWVLSL